MDKRPIGVFDSGLGGLTAVKEIFKILPNESIAYFGDTSRVPYGTRSKETIIKYTKQDVRFLHSLNIKALVVACGTVSAVAIDEARATSSVPLLGVLESAVNEALRVTKNERIGILGTTATIKSAAYERQLKSKNSNLLIVNNACPLFVPLVENGYFDENNQIAYLVAKEYLEPLIKEKVDTIILGCTHYPLLKKIISKIVGIKVNLIDPGEQAAKTLKQLLSENNLRSEQKQGDCFYVSDSTENFSQYASLFLGKDVNECVKKINIEDY